MLSEKNTDEVLLDVLQAHGHDKYVEDPDYVIGVTASYSTQEPGKFILLVKTYPIAIPELQRVNEKEDVLMPLKEVLSILPEQHWLSTVTPIFAEQNRIWIVNPNHDQTGSAKRAERELDHARDKLNNAAAIYAMLTAGLHSS